MIDIDKEGVYVQIHIYKTFQSNNINMKKKVIKSKAKFHFRNCCIRDVLFEYHRAVVPFGWAVRPVRPDLIVDF